MSLSKLTLLLPQTAKIWLFSIGLCPCINGNTIISQSIKRSISQYYCRFI